MRPALPPAFLHLPIAHRALHNRAERRIENSPAAIRAARAAGYAIEIDLQLSADGQAMVFHDEELDRLTHATGPVAARTAAELGQIALKDSTDTIPTLAETLTLVAGRVPLLIELKDQTLTLGQSDGRLEEAAARALEGYSGPVAVMSFNPTMMAHMARLAPHIPRGITTSAYLAEDWPGIAPETCDRLRDIPDYDAVGASFISHEAEDLSRPRVADLKAQGAAILCWTIRSPEAEAKARHIAQNVTFEGYASPLPA
ncbi:MAG: phosphodiesterase [Cypionkella sp.]|jgi:glycerophosphoryl diester phosphodiesterase|nr:phosphodiesterase [Cypionkella sp.]